MTTANLAPKAPTIREEVAERFTDEIAKHVVTIERNDGAFRHIVCKEPGTFNRAFTVTTWPGYLAITGDMGSFVFSRLHDMFKFFRKDSGDINPSYWQEKLVAVDKSGGSEKFDADLFISNVKEDLAEWLESYGEDHEDHEITELRQDIEGCVLSCAHDGEYSAISAAMEFEFKGQHIFSDFYERHCKQYTYHYLWCLHAIVWTIAKVDAMTTPETL